MIILKFQNNLLKIGMALIRDCNFHRFNLGAIHIWLEDQAKARILTCKVYFMDKLFQFMYNHYGIVSIGADTSPLIENNIIDSNTGPGIKVGISNKC